MGDLAARPQQMQRPHDIAADLPRTCSAVIAMEVNHAANRPVKPYPSQRALGLLAAECGGTTLRIGASDNDNIPRVMGARVLNTERDPPTQPTADTTGSTRL